VLSIAAVDADSLAVYGSATATASTQAARDLAVRHERVQRGGLVQTHGDAGRVSVHRVESRRSRLARQAGVAAHVQLQQQTPALLQQRG
jgi:hypothetical protein